MEIILLERVENLGNLGDVVNVKQGYARNYLLPMGKALRANKDNIAKFESERSEIEKINNQLKIEAEKTLKSIDDISITIIRAASETGQLYGSVSPKDIVSSMKEKGHIIEKQKVILNNTIKSLGLYPVKIMLHPEVFSIIEINVARSFDEAKTQKKIGKALIEEKLDVEQDINQISTLENKESNTSTKTIDDDNIKSKDTKKTKKAKRVKSNILENENVNETDADKKENVNKPDEVGKENLENSNEIKDNDT